VLPDNVREGNVLKPVQPTYINNIPILLKDKNNKFKEKACLQKGVESVPIPDDIKVVLDTVLPYVTDNRLDAVISKEGDEITHDKKLIGKLINLFTMDVMNDFRKENTISLAKKDMKKVTGLISQECRKLILSRL